MLALWKGLQNQWDASTIAAQMSGLWMGGAPATADTPLATCVTTLTGEKAMGGQDCVNAEITFGLFTDDDATEGVSSGLEKIGTLYGLLRTAFDDVILTITGYTSIYVTWASAVLMREPEGGWHYSIMYTTQLQEI